MLLAGEYVTSTVRAVNPDPRHHGQGHELVQRELRPSPVIVRCGVPLRIIGEPCARMAGHAPDGHRSRASMDNDNERRRSA
jgi:hypothetical protein